MIKPLTLPQAEAELIAASATLQLLKRVVEAEIPHAKPAGKNRLWGLYNALELVARQVTGVADYIEGTGAVVLCKGCDTRPGGEV
jgi:hypothetical protein